jgi:hypothetical protein
LLVINHNHITHLMTKNIRIISSILLLSIILIGIAELPVRKGYLNYKLVDTQYEKLLWMTYHFQSGKLKNNNFDIAVFGSSSSLYGFNDSVTNYKSINLGVNTGSRALELYLLEQFLINGNTAKYWVKEFHSLKHYSFDYYGLHPVLHYFVTPSWLIKNHQIIIQPHFLYFVFNRIKVVVQSWLFFHLYKEYNPSYTSYGYRPKHKISTPESYGKALAAELFDTIDNKQPMGSINIWRHNYETVKVLRKEFDRKIQEDHNKTVVYMYHPTLIGRIDNKDLLNRAINRLGETFQVNAIPCVIDSTFYYERLNWADDGHYSNSGAILFTKQAEQIILSTE